MEKIKAAVALLNCGKEQGTAFLVSDTLALTMSHCVEKAIEKGEDIKLVFKNIPDQEEIIISASIVPHEDNLPVSVLRLDKGITVKPLSIYCFNDHIEEKEILKAYGYPHTKGDEGYPINLSIIDYLSQNVAGDCDVVLGIDPIFRIGNFKGMSGSPVIYRNNVIGILNVQGIESVDNNHKAIDLKMISISRIIKLLDDIGIQYIPISYAEVEEELKNLQQPKEYCVDGSNYNERKRNCTEKYAADYCELDGAIEDYEKSIESSLKSIFSIKNKGNIQKAWNELRELTAAVRGSNSKPSKMLSRLYYIQACWYLDDYEDSRNSKKYIQKVLKINPDYDCRIYNAKKLFREGKVFEVNNVLYPIDCVAVLNTFIQLCVYNIKIEEAYEAFESSKKMANDGTYYLMSLICILDGDYESANQYLKKSNEEEKDIPLHIMMEGVILYWKLLPPNMIYGDSLLPAMYVNSILLPNTELNQKVNEIVSLYQRAYELAEIAENTELQKQILIVWLNTLTVSSQYRDDAYEIASKLMELEQYQFQAVIYYCIIGKEIPLRKDFDPTEIVQKKGNNIESMISCVYLFMNKKDYVSAYKKLKEYRFKFEEMHMMSHWFELAVRCCDDSKELEQILDSLEKFDMDLTSKERIKGMLLEALGENEKLIKHVLSLYQQTDLEIDLINLINCCEKLRDWKHVEYYCNDWIKKFHNPMANIKMVRCLALQNKQEECLNTISEIRRAGKEECLTNEVLFYEVQAFKIIGKYDAAIEFGKKLWSKNISAKVLILLAECYYLNVQEQEAIFILKDGIYKGIKNVEVYQMCAEYYKRISVNEAEKYVSEALMLSENDSHVILWAMNFLYSIGKSDKASELFVKLKALDKVNFFRTMTFKEAKEWIDKSEEDIKKRYIMYQKCQIPYHCYFDYLNNASYTFYSQQMWTYNSKKGVRKQALFTSFGGHNASIDALMKTMEKEIIIDFSSLIYMKHFEILDDIKTCWEQIVISGNISNIIALEQNKCLPNQPDMLETKKKIMETWKRKSLNFIDFPSQSNLDQWAKSGINLVDIIPYELAKNNNLVLVSNNFISDLLDESNKITDEMRNNVISTYELLAILEKRGDISRDLKNRYKEGRTLREGNELIDTLVGYAGKLPILVDENFLREMFELESVSVVSQKCNIHVISNIFDNIEKEIKQVEVAKNTYDFLEKLKKDIQEYREAGYIGYYGTYEDEHKRENAPFTNDFLDLYHYASIESDILVCDDRWVNSYNNFNDCFIYSVADIIELLHEQGIISDEKYIKIITQMFNEGYAYIVPPFEYVKLLLEQVPDGKDVYEEIPEELSIMCDYLVCITASEIKLDDVMVNQGVMPESVGYMYNLQRILIKLMKYVWCSEQSELWKWQVSDWLLANFSVFSYRTEMNDNLDSCNPRYYELELSYFLFSGFNEIPSDSYRKEYYNWLFNWFEKNSQWKDGLEDRLIQSLANIIWDVYNHENKTPYNDIGIAMLILSVTADMPEHYGNLIRRNELISKITEKFEDNFVYLGGKEFVPRELFNQWIDDAMKQGLHCEITRTNDKTKREYTITYIANVLLCQGFKIEYSDDNNKKTHYFRIDQAMLLSQDILLRTKGLLSLSSFITDSEIKKYQKYLKRNNWEEILEKIVTEIKLREDYIVYFIRYMLENETQMFSLEELFPNSTELFENTLANNSEEDVLKKMNQWTKCTDTNVANIFLQLSIYIYSHFKRNEIYKYFTENDYLIVAYYFADNILKLIIHLDENNRLIYSLQEISNWLSQLNCNLGYFDFFENQEIAPEERKKIEHEVAEYFKTAQLQQVKGSEIVSICKKLYYFEGESLPSYLLLIKEWIIEQCKKGKKGVDEEKKLLNVMEYYACVLNKEKPNQIVNSFFDLWEEILNQGIHIELSRSSIYILRRGITVMSFEHGIRMRKIVEKISLQK